jgi:hypothetical protein
MARLQALKQQRFLESSASPISSAQAEGSDGVPKFHPLKSSGPVFKASSMIHSLRVKKPTMPHSVKMPSIHMPKI